MGKTKCEDHLRNKYNSKKEMCERWGIPTDTFISRVRHGWTVEAALTTPVNGSTIHSREDHLGTTFKSKKEMCKHWGISVRSFDERISKGWPLQEALETPIKPGYQKDIGDHLGNKFESVLKMCKYWGVSFAAYNSRIAKGYTLEQALTIPSGWTNKCKDPNGKEFKSFKAMCNHYGHDAGVVKSRINNGESLAEALTRPALPGKESTDHKGNVFETKKAMCDHYGITLTTFNVRERLGWSLEKILTTPVKKLRRNGINLFDRHYTSVKEAALGINSKIALGSIGYRLDHDIDFIAATICPEQLSLSFISLDRQAHYKLAGIDTPMTTREIVAKFRPDLLPSYDAWNPKDLYIINRGGLDG